MQAQHFKFNAKKKYQRMTAGPKNTNLKYLHFEFLRLSRSEPFFFRTGKKETLINLLEGGILIEITNGQNKYRVKLGPRKNLFSSKSHAIYIPKNTDVVILPKSVSELIIVSTKAPKSSESFLIKPRDILVKNVGKAAYSRKVHHILREKDRAQFLIAGETLNEPGKWSSYPPHKHDRNNFPKETKLEELYFFRIHPKDKFGLIRIYEKKGRKNKDQVFAIGHNDLVIIPSGYHPVSALPETKLYYFWALAGKKRQLRFSSDPAFLT